MIRLTTRTLGAIDHVAIAVRDADKSIPYYRDVLGLPLVGDEVADQEGVRLVYFDAGNVLVQLVQPVRDDAPVASWLDDHDEGLHHVCFYTDDLVGCAALFNGDKLGSESTFPAGRGGSAFFMITEPNNVKIEVTGKAVL